MTTGRTVKMTYRGERLLVRIELEDWHYRATAYRGNEFVGVTDLYTSAGEACAAAISGLIDAVEFIHSEAAFENDRDGMDTYE